MSTPSTNDIPFAVGMGYDVHSFAPGRKLMLGGVQIDYRMGLDGHSDADVLIHAIMDALLGAAGMPDIGHLFPPDDERWRDSDSKTLLRDVIGRIREQGWRVGNVDSTLIAESPKISPHIGRMKEALAAELGITPGRVGIKATTNEKLGFLGRGEGIAAMATALLVRVEK